MKDWVKVNLDLWNSHLTYQQNQMNGCNLPNEGDQVLFYDSDKPKYFVGSVGQDIHNPNRLVVYESVHGNIYGGLDYMYWTTFEYCT